MAVSDAREKDKEKALKGRAKARRSKQRRDRRARYLDGLRGSHHGIQAAAARLTALGAALVVLLAATVAGYATKGRSEFLNTSLYTKGFTTSASNLTGEVVAFAENASRTRSFQLYRISASQGSTALGLPPAADDYHAFLLGLKDDGRVLKPWKGGKVKGTITQYGSGGYIGVTLESDRPFPSQRTALVIQSQIASASAKRTQNSTVDKDTPYAELMSDKYDTWVIIQNLGGADMATPSWMERLDERKALYPLVYDRQIKDARKKLIAQSRLLRDELETMKADQRAFAGMRSAGVGVARADLPADVAGDSVGDDHGLRTGAPVPGAWTFDWQHFDGEHGMPAGVIPEGQDLAAYVADQRSRGQDGQSGASDDGDLEAGWLLTNGQDASWLASQGGGAAGAATFGAMTTAMGNLTQDIAAYRADKEAFMTTMMQPMVDAEIEYLAAMDSVSQGHWMRVR